MNLDDVRREYLQTGLSKQDLKQHPIEQFKFWMQNAIDAELADPTAMCLATVNDKGEPNQRIVLLKHCDEKGFVFYTNLDSQKAKDISQNKHVHLHFPWLALERQVRISGMAEKLTVKEALHYFSSRPEASQLAAWASNQSHPISSRQILEQQFAKMKQKFLNKEIPIPSFWGGYRVIPHQFEFWQGRGQRLHDRFQFTKDIDRRWIVQRLAP